ncbi:MAG: hypothetical protein U0795_19460 [Pirellulales bacterium]
MLIYRAALLVVVLFVSVEAFAQQDHASTKVELADLVSEPSRIQGVLGFPLGEPLEVEGVIGFMESSSPGEITKASPAVMFKIKKVNGRALPDTKLARFQISEVDLSRLSKSDQDRFGKARLSVESEQKDVRIHCRVFEGITTSAPWVIDDDGTAQVTGEEGAFVLMPKVFICRLLQLTVVDR